MAEINLKLIGRIEEVLPQFRNDILDFLSLRRTSVHRLRGGSKALNITRASRKRTMAAEIETRKLSEWLWLAFVHLIHLRKEDN